MLEVRKRHPVFGLGTFEVCPSENDAILSYVRIHHQESGSSIASDAVLCVNNLSSRPQATTIRLPEEFKGAQLIDLFGGQGFPKVSDDGQLTLTLGSRDFFWLRLETGSAHG
jgi:maltose alpha-D-glucosyltransferase/alpha-amylase